MAERISFHRHEVKFRLAEPELLKAWIGAIVRAHHRKIDSLVIVFCSDPFLLEINRQFLHHDDLTDIITFDLSATSGQNKKSVKPTNMTAEIYISTDRVRENANTYGVSFGLELRRVIIHGVLHLLGNKDKTTTQKAQMRLKEDACLSLLYVPRGTWGKRIKQLFHVEH